MSVHTVPTPPTNAPDAGHSRRRLDGRALPLAALALVAAAAHVPVTGEHLEEARYIGVLFIALEVACVLLAVALVARPSRAVFAATSAVGALAVLALVVSRTIGLPLIQDDIGVWTEPLAWISLVSESLMAVGGAAAAAGWRARAVRTGVFAAVLILLLGGGATVAASAATPAETHGDERSGEMRGHDMNGHDMDGMHMGFPAPSAAAAGGPA
jgi:hypothetical protein